MVTVNDLGDTVELGIVIPVEKRELLDFANAIGYTPADTKIYCVHVAMKYSDYVRFIEDIMMAFTQLQLDRADAIKRELDGNGTAQ